MNHKTKICILTIAILTIGMDAVAWSGSGTDSDPYLIKNSDDWRALVYDVEDGNSHSGHVFRMTADINTNGRMVGSSGNAFCGIFDGDGHTMTFDVGSRETPDPTEVKAPFRYVCGATIRHLRTQGDIYTIGKFTAGIVGCVMPGSVTQLADCHSGVFIYTFVVGDGSHGGLIGDVNTGGEGVVIDHCSFTGRMANYSLETTRCGGFVGWAASPVVIRHGLLDQVDRDLYNTMRDGATFARMDDGVSLTLEQCYATSFFSTEQGTFITDTVHTPDGVTFEFVDEPFVRLDGTSYYTTGCRIRLTVPEGTEFHHWETNGCFISDPWTAGGIHCLKDLRQAPSLGISTSDIPKPETIRTLWGVTYRYLSRSDYHYFISDEDCTDRGWKFESGDTDANLVVYDSDGDASEITAIVGYDESDYNSDGVQIHNDLVGDWRAHTHLGMISPHAFQNSTALETLYFKDTDANNYNALLPFDFYICEGAFDNCPNFREMKMMQYTTRGTNHWEALKPDQVVSIADDAFSGCDKLKISVHNSQYQNFMGSASWRQHRSRFIIYEATTEDFTVKGVKYHWYRNAQETDALKNDESGKSQMMDQLRTWNADYQQFSAASLLETNSTDNVYYTSVIGVDDDDIDDAGGIMRIYNDPGEYYNYKTIQLQRDAIAGNTHVKHIEFYQTNGRSENSFSDLKIVIPNGAFKDCKNLEELRLFYYVQDGEDRWIALGPKDVIPGDNIFGRVPIEDLLDMTQEEQEADRLHVPENFKVLVSPELYQDFLDDPNWLPYIGYIEPVDFEPSGKKKDFSEGGLTYSHMTAPGGILQTSQVVSQDVSWWTAPRIAIEVALAIYSIASTWAAIHAGEAGGTALQAAMNEVTEVTDQLTEQQVLVKGGSSYWLELENLGNFKTSAEVGTALRIDYFTQIGLNAEKKLWFERALQKATKNWFDCFIREGIISEEGKWIATKEVFEDISHTSFKDFWSLITAFQETFQRLSQDAGKKVAELTARQTAAQATLQALQAKYAGNIAMAPFYSSWKGMAAIAAKSGLATTASVISSQCWGGTGTYNADLLNKGMRENILSNIHQVGLVGGGYVITTPQKNLVYHTYIKEVGDNVTDAVIYAGFDNDGDRNSSNRTMTFARNAFRDKTSLQTVKFHENPNGQTSNTGMPLLLTIPDSAFVGCTSLREFSTLLQTKSDGTRALGPENFILAGDSIFAGLDSLQFHIVIDPLRKQDFLDSESWGPLQRYFVYESATPAPKEHEYGAWYAYAYENNSIKKQNKVGGHLIEHTVVTGPDDDFIKKHQGAVKLCHDIGVWNNYQLDEVMPKAFKGNEHLRTVSFTDLLGAGAFGDVYTDFQTHIGDSAFVNCKNLANLDLLYMVTDGTNHLDPLTPQQLTIGNGVFDGTTARLKMMPQQVAWFEADSTWAQYKERFMPCIIKLADPAVQKVLKSMSYYDPANTGTDDSHWDDYADLARIAGAGFDWLDGKFTNQSTGFYSFPDFQYFESVGLDYVGESWFENCSELGNILLPSTLKAIRRKAFKNCLNLSEIELPRGLQSIENEAFGNCVNMTSVIVRDSVPAMLGTDVFHKHEALRIYVPVPKVSLYRQQWSEYAPYIVGDNEYTVNKVVTVTEAGQLADKLGLGIHKDGGKVRYLTGPYAKYDSLTVRGPLNGLDLAVIRHLAGADAYDSDPTDGRLRYLNLWDAYIKKDKTNCYNGNWIDEFIDEDDIVPDYLFENCAAIETVVFPKSATEVGENIFEEATSMKRLAVGRKTTKYDTDLLQDINGLEELVLLTEGFATNNSIWPDPWEAPIQQVFTLPSKMGDYMGDPKLTRQAHDITAPFSDDEVMWALADAGHFFPSAYLVMESAENIFNGNTAIKDLDEFVQFQNVRELDHTFSGMANLENVTLPYFIERIGAQAFTGCDKLQTVRISCDSVPELGDGAFDNVPDGFRILVPKSLCKLYREKWPQYAHLINPDDSHADEDIIMVNTTVYGPNTVAQLLDLMIRREKSAWNSYRLNSLRGDYSKIRRVKIVGPISGGDFDVLRHLAGYSPWGHCHNYSGKLEYLDLYDAEIVESEICLRSQASALNGTHDEFYDVKNNVLPRHAFLKAYNLKTLILPRTCKKVEARALQECEGLETLVIGDDCEDFNWNALDDDAMLTRMYILAKEKVKISTQNALWRALCNNYNPTFDAFYVRPSLYNDYLYDDAYTGSSWQRTNNVSKGMFDDDESFCVFASHAAATADELMQVYTVNGWFDNHTGVRDLTALGYTIVDSLHAADMQKLTQLERVTLPVTLTAIEDSVFAKSPGLRYVDMLMCDSTMIVDDIRARGLAKLGIDSLQTLVYLPMEYGEAKGVNIVVAGSADMRAETFRLTDGLDYCVPYSFHADKVENSRQLTVRSTPYTVCVPYDMDKPANTRVYRLSDREGSALVFSEIPSDAKMEACKPYLMKVIANKRRRSTSPVQLQATDVTLPVSKSTWGKQDDALGYSVRGTLTSIDNAEAAAMGAYILQEDGDWHPVRSGTDAEKQAYVPAFRMYLLPSARYANSFIGMELEDIEDIEHFKTIDLDGTERIYDLNGRQVGENYRGVIIKNGKKVIRK